MQIVLAIEKETGIGLQEMASLKRGERLRMARGILTLLTREIGYNMKELQGILKRDVSVVSRLASIGEMYAERKTKCITASLTPYCRKGISGKHLMGICFWMMR
jgi:hypothetical protein